MLLESPKKIRQAARYIVRTREQGDDPVVVVSAPGRATDHLLRWAGKVSDKPEGRELDMLLSVGERMAIALLALAINSEGKYRAVSFTGSQVGIITDTRHTDASIVEVKGYRIREAILANQIPIIAGFQGISTDKEITTLGRGGSDATAVALAAALGADRCELVKEFGGIFSADPLIVNDAQKLAKVDYTTLESMTQAGAKVVQPRASALAREHNVILSINAPDGRRGTLVVDHTLTREAVAALTLRKGTLIAGKARSSADEAAMLSKDLFYWDGANYSGVSFEKQQSGTAVDVLTVIGWGGQLPTEAVRKCVNVLNEVSRNALTVYRSASALTLVLPESSGKSMIEQLHTSLLKSGFIERSPTENS